MISITLELISFISLSHGVSTIRLHIVRENTDRTVVSCWLNTRQHPRYPSTYVELTRSRLIHTKCPRYKVYREVSHAYSVPNTEPNDMRARVSIYPRMEILSLPNEPNKIESGYVLLSSSFNKSVVSPCQNNNACSCVQVC